MAKSKAKFNTNMQMAAKNAVAKAAAFPSKNTKKPVKPGNFHPNNPKPGMHPLHPHRGKGKHLPNLTPGQIKNAAKRKLKKTNRGGASWAQQKGMEGAFGHGLS